MTVSSETRGSQEAVTARYDRIARFYDKPMDVLEVVTLSRSDTSSATGGCQMMATVNAVFAQGDGWGDHMGLGRLVDAGLGHADDGGGDLERGTNTSDEHAEAGMMTATDVDVDLASLM